MTKEEKAVIDEAVKLWTALKPVEWTQKKHLLYPCVNTTDSNEVDLAFAVVAYLKSKSKKRKGKVRPL